VPASQAKDGHIAREVPVYEPKACAGCPQIPICKERGSSTVFLVQKVRGKPVYCQKIGADLIAALAKPMPELEPRHETAVPHPHGPLLLCDASVFINAERWQWQQCRLVLEHAGRGYRLATTRPVFQELRYAYKLPPQLEILDVDLQAIHPRVLELAKANAAYENPRDAASLRDLSLVQATLDHAEVHGILCEDDDLRRLHTPSVVRELTGRDTLLMTCDEFCRSKKALFPQYEGAG